MYRMQNPNPNPSSKSVTSSPCDGTCFVAGTLVETENGSLPIEQITAGMLVYATDPETGETELKEVVNSFVRESSELVHITVNGEEITATPTHPFWVPQRGWTDAIDLRAGDRLQLLNGEYVIIEQVQHELLESPETTYNFEVKDFHTYYVGEQGIFTHNMCKKAQIKNPSKSESRVWKGFKNSKNGLKTSGSGKNQRFYSWDNLHNEIEVFDRLGKHLGVMDPTTGEMIKSAVKGRWLKL
ncbi:MAG: colicin E3/pyocin S6 family cytotoxin [Oscillospiraceae bacterium]|nr:MAG: colicin E3/pyocin S6 family cytotoxin [Oscillospiraceae bacterium]